MKGLETYKMIFKEGKTTGVYGISLVENPAMESLWVALKKHVQLKAIDPEKQIVLGAVLIPDKPIYRNEQGREFNIVFPAETIRLAAENFYRQGHQNTSTLEHDDSQKLSGVTCTESWIKEDAQFDKSVKYGFDDPVGTWYVSMKIDNKQTWEDYIKTGKVKGFSIDGLFDTELIKLSEELINLNTNEEMDLKEEIVKLRQAVIDGFAGKKEVKLETEKPEVTPEVEKPADVKLGTVKTADGETVLNFEGDTVKVGTQFTMTSPEGELPVPDGSYTLEDGVEIILVNSVVSEVKEASAEAPAEDKPSEAPLAAPEGSPVVKSEKSTQEIFYQLSEVIIQEMEKKFAELELKMTANIQEKEAVSLTKKKPAVAKSYNEMSNYEKLKYNREH